MDDKDLRKSSPDEQKPQTHNYQRALIMVLSGILIVLIVANLSDLLQPIVKLIKVLAPIIIGFAIAYIANPILRFFEVRVFYRIKRKLANRALSMLLTYIVLLLVIGGIVALVIPRIADSINDLRENGSSYINRLIASINRVFEGLPVRIPGVEDNVLTLDMILNWLVERLTEYGLQLLGSIGAIASGALNVLKNILIGLFVSIYVLLSKDRLYAGTRRVIRGMFSERHERVLYDYFGTANSKFGGFIVGKLMDSVIVGFIAAVVFTVFRIPYPTMIAVIIGVTNVIPFFGPFIGAIPSAAIIFLVSPSKAFVFIILIVVIQQFDGNLLGPMILGDHTGLTSLGVLVSVTLMGGLMGVPGMLIGVPLFSVILTILDDMLKSRLQKKGCPTDIYSYYSADAFIKPREDAPTGRTLSKRFADWVAAVETEQEGVDYMPSKWHSFGRMIRSGLLATGRFFHRTFTTKPQPEDQTKVLFPMIFRRGMHTNRWFWRSLLLTIITFGIYPLYLIELMAECTNVACAKDGKRTRGLIPYLFLSVLTLGIFGLLWHVGLIRRWRDLAEEHGETCPVTGKFFVLWMVPGVLCLVGPFIAFARLLRGFNQMCRIFNETHTFPLDPASIAVTVPAPPAAPETPTEETQTDVADEPMVADDSEL